jgi:bacteriocin-like protein
MKDSKQAALATLTENELALVQGGAIDEGPQYLSAEPAEPDYLAATPEGPVY